MQTIRFPVIDPVATGENIVRLRKERGLSVRDLQSFFGFEEPQAIYKWQRGQSLPTVDNLYALGALFGVSMDEILISSAPARNHTHTEQQAKACCSVLFPAAPDTAENRKRSVQFFAAPHPYVRAAQTASFSVPGSNSPNSEVSVRAHGADGKGSGSRLQPGSFSVSNLIEIISISVDGEVGTVRETAKNVFTEKEVALCAC